MRHLSYAAMLAVVLVGTLPLHRVFRLDLARQLRRVALSILPVAVVFVVWDVAATRAGHWAFDPGQTLSVRVLGLPLEELAFFLVIPLAGLLTYEAVGVVLARRRDGRRDRGARPPRSTGAGRRGGPG
ncbi:lycopene cyclase domain-containing protein [Lapillicoccus sp.]|jgi:lycopene cyclase domain-containing protein|uniref:lycopene cyclase domain-containing protein n=1 Tax=Lapillicoccus sp. TaxID=1909287 RepID=UPI0025F08150|nr:lycopene cyclase domain-containing protein [Lapillicoccus sp.]